MKNQRIRSIDGIAVDDGTICPALEKDAAGASGKEERIVYSAASGRQKLTASALKLKEALAGGAWSVMMEIAFPAHAAAPDLLRSGTLF